MNRQKMYRITRGGLLLALTAMLTAYVRVPLPVGYAHLGDGAVILSGLILGPFGAVCAAAGTALADLLSGYPFYIPFSILIKAFIAFGAGKWIRGEERLSRRNLLILCGLLLWVPAGYFPADALFYGLEAAVFSLAGNFAQAGVGCVISAMLLAGGVGARK